MIQQLVQLNEEVAKKVFNATHLVRNMQNEGEIVAYEQFVENLFKKFAVAQPGMDEPLIDITASLHHATTGISGEGGELLDITKKCWVYGKGLDVANLIEELGDLRFYYQALLNMVGLTDEDVKAANMMKLSLGPDARYPGGVYSDQAAIARADKVQGSRNFIGSLANQPAPAPLTQHTSASMQGAEAFDKVKEKVSMGTMKEVEDLLEKTANPFEDGTVGHLGFRNGFLTAGLAYVTHGG